MPASLLADCRAVAADLPDEALLLLAALTVRPPPALPLCAVADLLLVVPIELPMREVLTELTRVLELEVDRPALLERTSTVLCTFDDLLEGLLEDLPLLATLRELLLEERLGVALVADELDRAELEREELGRDDALLELLRLETDVLRRDDEGRDAREELEERLVAPRLLLELLLLALLPRELELLRALLLRELLLELLLLELLLLELLPRELPLLALLAKTGSISRIAATTAATMVITTCFLRFSVNMIIPLSLYSNTRTKRSILSLYP